MWTEIAHAQHNREKLHFASDLTNREWEVLQPFLTVPTKP
jgi:hypothetical protein